MEITSSIPSGRIHFIGIGGIGMSAVARFLLERGCTVSGSDVKESSLTKVLRAEGAQITIGHSAANVDGAELIVYSTAVVPENVERVEGSRRGIPVVHRSHVLGLILAGCGGVSVGVTGTHGKGTTSSLISWILYENGDCPGFIIGALPYNFGRNAACGGGSVVVAEVDESDGSHLNVKPSHVVCHNLELDHLNYYSGLEDIIATQQRFIEDNPCLRMLALNVGDEGIRLLAERLSSRLPIVRYGVVGNGGQGDTPEAEYLAVDARLEATCATFRVLNQGQDLGDFRIPLPGEYNIDNALAAIATTHWMGVPVQTIKRALGGFKGLENRFTVVEGGGVVVVKDYLSHPTGMKAVLAAARRLGPGRLWAVYKPYRFTLLKYLGGEYAEALGVADQVLLTDMFTAGEEPIPGIDNDYLRKEIAARRVAVDQVAETEDIPPYLMERVEPGDVVVLFGGDDFFRMADGFIADLEGNR